MINSTGVPAKNSFVQNERRQVCEVSEMPSTDSSKK